MEIKNLQSNMINAYKNVVKTGAPAKKNASPAAAKTDKVEIDFGRYLGAAKADAAGRIDVNAGADRIEQLSQKYAGDNCPVSAEDVAAAVLGE